MKEKIDSGFFKSFFFKEIPFHFSRFFFIFYIFVLLHRTIGLVIKIDISFNCGLVSIYNHFFIVITFHLNFISLLIIKSESANLVC